ncbi:hypothetical protein ASF40_19940 [Microbacterium sp. Leaf288]|uniref:hypothetical protein n=1 Tax=Microbacterium sp. Leaf288 TaxID=1736323 RepID=UPI0007002DCC|nr:hypothetical protein [Microbacterium sp. Leaf288]KQP67804.1 hypothetical protein ASF40_19940 [Microbacterium sp. Leaf288]
MSIPTQLLPLAAATAIASTLAVLLLPIAAGQLLRGHPIHAARTTGAAALCAVVVVVLATALATSTFPPG